MRDRVCVCVCAWTDVYFVENVGDCVRAHGLIYAVLRMWGLCVCVLIENVGNFVCLD